MTTIDLAALKEDLTWQRLALVELANVGEIDTTNAKQLITEIRRLQRIYEQIITQRGNDKVVIHEMKRVLSTKESLDLIEVLE